MNAIRWARCVDGWLAFGVQVEREYTAFWTSLGYVVEWRACS